MAMRAREGHIAAPHRGGRVAACLLGLGEDHAGRGKSAVVDYDGAMPEGRRPDGRLVRERLVRMGIDEASCDREFWARMTPEQRVDFLWDMVLDAMEAKGIKDFGEQGLQRSVGRILRR